MDNFGSEIGQKMRSAVKAKLLELGTGGSAGYIDDELPDYVMIMVANKRSKQQMITDLNLFLGTQTELFVTWLHEVLQKLQEVTLPAANATNKKRKTSQKEDPNTIASHKKDKKSNKKDKKPSSTKKITEESKEDEETPSTTTGLTGTVICSITDVFAEDLLEKAKKTLDVNAAANLNIKNAKAKIVTDATEVVSSFDIQTTSEISSTTEVATCVNRENDLAELQEIQKKIYAAKKHLKNLEHHYEDESEDDDFLNLKDDESAEEFNEVKNKVSTAKSPIVFDQKPDEEDEKVQPVENAAEPARQYRHTTPTPMVSAPIVTASHVDRRAISPMSKNPFEIQQPRRSRDRERRDPPSTKKASVHERLGHNPKLQREEGLRERRTRHEKEIYVPAFRRKENAERVKDQQRDREHNRERNRDRGRDRSPTRRRSSPEEPSSSTTQVANGRHRSLIIQTVNSDARQSRNSNGKDVEASNHTQRKRIGSRVIVAAQKQIEPSDDDDLTEKPINSVIKIKPRVAVSPSKQASKNLLLRAVAEAQRSTILQIKPKPEPFPTVTVNLPGPSASERNTKLYSKSYRDRLKRGANASSSTSIRRTTQNLIIEVGSDEKKRRRRQGHDELKDDEYVPATLSEQGESDADFAYVPQSITNAVANELIEGPGYQSSETDYVRDDSLHNPTAEKTQFVVTLNDDKTLPNYKRLRAQNSSSHSHSHSPQPHVSSSSVRCNLVEASSTTRSKRSREHSREQSRLQHSPAALAARLADRDSTNSSPSSNTPPPPRRTELIEIYRKPKEIKKIIIKNDSEDEEHSPQKEVHHCSRSRQNRNSIDKQQALERSMTPPIAPKKIHIGKHSVGSDEKVLPTQTPLCSPVKRKRTQIKFDLNRDTKANEHRSRDDRRYESAVVTTRRSKSYDRDDSQERGITEEIHNHKQKISIRNTEANKYDNIPSLSSVAIDSTVIKVNKPKERCKYHPNCTKHNCDFYHPSAPCKSFPNCKFADKCMYSHPKCKFDMSCTNIDCNFSHSGTRNPSILQPTAPPLSSHVVPVQNYKSISAAPAASSTMCKYYPNCSKIGCTFFHPKPCRFGKNCINKLECNFYHHELQSSNKFKWVASVS